MTSVYPGAIDALSNPTPTSATSNPSHAEQHEDSNDAIEAIETELGTNPSGASATVAARFTAAETATSDHLADTTDAHDASAISFVPTGTIAGTDTQTAVAEVATDAAASLATHAALASHASSSGTSFPAQPAYGNNVPFSRTDLGIAFYYNGTRWLSVHLYRSEFFPNTTLQSYSADNTFIGLSPPWEADFDLWLETFYASTYVATTNDGTKFWTVTFRKASTAFAATTIVSFTTAADAVDTIIRHKAAVGALLTPASFPLMAFGAAKTSTPGNLTLAAAFTYRLVG